MLHLTAKQEAFARRLAAGETQADAYRYAYSSEGMAPPVVWSEASRLAANPKVASRVLSLRAEAEEMRRMAALDREEAILKRLEHEATTARTDGARVRVAQAEREAISRRTKEALAVAKARGVRLGNPNGAECLRRAGKGGVALRAAVAANADGFAVDLADVVADIRAAGHRSLRGIASELTVRGIRTRRGGAWGVGNVKGLLMRLSGTGRLCSTLLTSEKPPDFRLI